MVREPRAVLREFGTEIPDDVTVRVHDSTADMRYLVLPQRPAGTEGWDEERLRQLVTRDAMIGVSLALRPGAASSKGLSMEIHVLGFRSRDGAESQQNAS
jgi:nitrile hydratase